MLMIREADQQYVWYVWYVHMVIHALIRHLVRLVIHGADQQYVWYILVRLVCLVSLVCTYDDTCADQPLHHAP